MLAHLTKLCTFYQCVIVALLLTNAVSIVVAMIALRLAQLDLRTIAGRRFGEIRKGAVVAMSDRRSPPEAA